MKRIIVDKIMKIPRTKELERYVDDFRSNGDLVECFVQAMFDVYSSNEMPLNLDSKGEPEELYIEHLFLLVNGIEANFGMITDKQLKDMENLAYEKFKEER